MAPPITIEALKLEGFRAYLQPQTIQLYRGKTPLSLAIFAPNAKGKSSLVDAVEFYFSEDATLRRLGKRAAQRHAGPGAMEHVDAQSCGVNPTVHLWFRKGQDKFDEARPVTATATALPGAAQRVLAGTALPFIIRGHELRSFVEEETPEDRYKEIAAWFALHPLVTIQQNLRKLRRRLKQRVESTDEARERLRDLTRITNGAVTAWDNAKVCAWLNTNVLAHLNKNLMLSELTASDTGYQELVQRKAAEDRLVGLATLKRLLTLIEALFKTPAEEGEAPAGTIVTFENAVSKYVAAVARESAERSKASQSVFNQVWSAAKDVFENGEISFYTCPVCDTNLEFTPHGSREKVRVSIETKLADLTNYRNAADELEKAKKALEGAARAVKNGLGTVISNLTEAGYKYKAQKITAYHHEIKIWEIGDAPPDSAAAVQELQSLRTSIAAEKERIEKQQGEHTYANALKTADDLLQVKADLNRIDATKAELRRIHEQPQTSPHFRQQKKCF